MRGRLILCCLVVNVAAAGCSVVTDYPSRTRGAQAAFNNFDFDRAAGIYKDKQTSLDHLCYRLERGTAMHTAGSYDESNRLFEQAFQDVRDFDNRASVSVRDSTAFLGTLVINEKTVPYRGESFERVYIHTFSAMNYLLKGDTSGARVEIRRAYNRQTKERLAHQEEYDEAVKQSRSHGVSSSQALSLAQREYRTSGALKSVNIFQDAFSFYLSSLVYEVLGEYGEAVVDAKKILVLRPESRLARQQIARCAKKAPGLVSGGAKAYGDVAIPGPGQGEVVVLYACGLAPVKREMKISLPVPSGRGLTYNKVAFPVYRRRGSPVVAAEASVGGSSVGRTEVLSDVERKAMATLSQRLPTLVMKSILRAAVRYGIQKGILDAGHRKDRGLRQVIAFGVGVVGAVVEQADLRSWLTLPQTFQATRGVVPAGSHSLSVELMGGHGSALGVVHTPIEVREGRITVVVVRSVGARAVVHAKAL